MSWIRFAAAASLAASLVTAEAATLGGCPMFPAAAIFNSPIHDTARFPVHASSQAWKSLVRPNGGAGFRLHLDMGMSEDPAGGAYYGIPYNLLSGGATDTRWSRFSFLPTDANDDAVGWGDQSDCALRQADGSHRLRRGCDTVAAPRFPYPLADTIKVESGLCNPALGPCPYADHHLLVVETGSCRLWEGYYTYQGRQGWHESSVAAWNLRSLAMRPDGWTSGDAAGLPILPLLLRAEEADSGVITHALRGTFRNGVMANRYDWPASHAAGLSDLSKIPFGALLRLRKDFVIPATWTTQAKAVARAMQVHGIYVADNGSDFFVQGEPSARWQEATFDQLQSGLTLDQFDFVDLGQVTRDPRFSPRSYRGRW